MLICFKATDVSHYFEQPLIHLIWVVALNLVKVVDIEFLIQTVLIDYVNSVSAAVHDDVAKVLDKIQNQGEEAQVTEVVADLLIISWDVRQ